MEGSCSESGRFPQRLLGVPAKGLGSTRSLLEVTRRVSSGARSVSEEYPQLAWRVPAIFFRGTCGVSGEFPERVSRGGGRVLAACYRDLLNMLSGIPAASLGSAQRVSAHLPQSSGLPFRERHQILRMAATVFWGCMQQFFQ